MKKEENKQIIEREYTIPLREKIRHVPNYRKTPKAVKTIKEFLAKHMKIRDRDLKKIKIDLFLNEMLWFRGIRSPPHKIKVKVIKVGEIVKVQAVDLIKDIEFKKKRLEKRESLAQEVAEKKKTLMQKAKEQVQGQAKPERSGEDKNQDGIEDKAEEKEKAKAVAEETQKQVKIQAKQTKHQMGGKAKERTRPVRVALDK